MLRTLQMGQTPKTLLSFPAGVFKAAKRSVPNIIIIGALLTFCNPTFVLIVVTAIAIFSWYLNEDDSRVRKSDFSVSIAGAGFSGIAMGIRLQKMGVKYTIYEMAPKVGGVWWYNKYPGCACDIPSHVYSLSSELKADWSRQYAPQEEIQKYLENLATQWKLNIVFNTRCTKAQWHDDCHMYSLTLTSGEKQWIVWSNVLIGGIGGLREVIMPEFAKSTTTFQGRTFHSSCWDTNFDYANKNVGIIGTGASAVQIIPKICRDVTQLFVFQRTPTWSIKKFDFEIPSIMKWVFRMAPFTMKFYRFWLFLFFELRYFLGYRTNFVFGNNLMRLFLQLRTQYIVRNARLARDLTPDYAPGCKQVAPSDDYFHAYRRGNVHLIVSPVRQLTKEGIETEDGNNYKLDAIVYATGFSPLETGKQGSGNVYNSSGERLADKIGDEPFAYLGICYQDSPNGFSLLGPNTGLGHNSVIFMIECQVNYVSQCIRYMIKTKQKSMTIKHSAMSWFKRFLAKQMPKHVFHEGCTSWYRNKDGTGRNYTLWPGSSILYWWYTKQFNPDDYIFECP